MTEACKVAVPKTADPVLKMFFGSMQKFSLIILLSDSLRGGNLSK